MKIPLFRIGLVILALGIVWTSVTFLHAERTTEQITLQTNHSADLEILFTDTGIGYYKIFLPQFSGNGVFVQILDNKNNVISEKMIETKMSVNYFDYSNGKYTFKVSNLSENKTLVIEFGSTNSDELIYPGIVMLLGVLVLIIGAYIRMKNYKIAQPDENIS